MTSLISENILINNITVVMRSRSVNFVKPWTGNETGKPYSWNPL